jgi:hypothetical protein
MAFRVTGALRKAGVTTPSGPGADRSRLAASSGELPDLPQLMRAPHEEARLSSPQIAVLLGMPERTVRDRLRMYGVTVRTRGYWNREDRTTAPAQTLELLYGQVGMTADEVGQRLGMSRNLVLRQRARAEPPWATWAHARPSRRTGRFLGCFRLAPRLAPRGGASQSGFFWPRPAARV